MLTVKPGNGDTFKEHEEQQAHAAGRIVIEEFEDINAALQEQKRGGWVPLPWGPVYSIQGQHRLFRLGLGYPVAGKPDSRLEQR